MFLSFKMFHNLIMSKNDTVLLLEILKLKLSVVSVEKMVLYTDTQKCEAVNGILSPFIFFLFCLLMNLQTNSLMKL